MMEYNKENVEYAYKMLNLPLASTDRASYNQFLINFQQSEVAWRIAEELLSSTEELSRFFAAQTLYTKLSKEGKHFSSHSPLLHLKDNLLNMLDQNSGTYTKPTLNKLALCVSVIVLHTISTTWITAISDIVSYSLKSPSRLSHGIFILQNIATELIESRIRLTNKPAVEQTLAAEFPKVIDYVRSVLAEPGLPLQVKRKATKILTSWIELEDITVPGLKELLLETYRNTELSSKVTKPLMLLLEKSAIVPTADDPDMLEKCTNFFRSELAVFVSEVLNATCMLCSQQGNSIDMLKRYSDVAFAIGLYYPAFLLRNDEIAKRLISLLTELCAVKDKEILNNSFEVWESITESIRAGNEFNLDLSYIYPYFGKVIELFRESCEFEGDDASNEEFIKMKNYRIYASGNMLSLFDILHQANPKEAEALICSMSSKIAAIPPIIDSRYLRTLESFVFFAQSLFDAFEIAQVPVPYFVDMFRVIFAVKPNSVLAHSTLLYIKEGARQLNFVPELISSAIDYCLYVAGSFPLLQGLAGKTVEEVAESCAKMVDDKVVEKVEEFVKTGINVVKPETVGMLAKTIGILHIGAKDLPKAIQRFLTWLITVVHNTIKTPALPYIIQIVSNYVKSFVKSGLDHKTTSTALSGYMEQLVTILCEVLKTGQLVNLLVGTFVGILEIADISVDAKASILQTMVQVWEANVLQAEVLKVLGVLITSFSDEEAIIGKICSVFLGWLPRLTQNQALQVAEGLADYLKKVAEVSVDLLVKQKDIENVLNIFCSFVSTVCEQDANQKILALFKTIVQARSVLYKENFEVIQYNIMYSTMQSIPLAQFTMTDVAKILSAGLVANAPVANSAIIAALSSEKYRDIPEPAKKIFAEYVNQFKEEVGKIKAIVRVLHNILNSMGETEDLVRFQLQMNEKGGIVTIS